MENIKYRKIEKRDYLAVGEILNQSFGLFHYVSDKKTLGCFKLQYVYSCLAEATYTCVAEKDNKIVGVIMENAKTDYSVFKHILYLWKTIKYSLKMKYYSKKSNTRTDDYDKIHKIYHQFSKKHKGEFDGVLTLFAVDESCRGAGVGKTLLFGLLKYLEAKETKRIYLYTDTTCNYGFYEHMGFKRLEEEEITLKRDGKMFKMKVFLYDYTV